MNKVIPVIVFLLTLAGCAKQQDLAQKNESAAPVAQITKEEAGTVEEKVIETASEVTAAADESGFQVAPPAGIVAKMQVQMKAPPQEKEAVSTIEGAQDIIAENRWGFSVYDPQSRVEQFYTSKGVLLGSYKK